MNHALKHVFVAGLLATLGLAANAQAPAAAPGSAPAPMMGRDGPRHFDPAKMQERRAERMAKRMAALKQKLQITAAQEGAWNTFTTAMRPPQMQRPSREEMARLTTPERIDRMRAMRTARMAEMDKRAEATKVFYAALTPEQKKTFDEITARRGFGGDRGRHGRHHG